MVLHTWWWDWEKGPFKAVCGLKFKEVIVSGIFLFPHQHCFSLNHRHTVLCNLSGCLFLYLTVRIGQLGNFSRLIRLWEMEEVLWIHTLCKLNLENRKLRMAGRKRKYPNKENAVEGAMRNNKCGGCTSQVVCSRVLKNNAIKLYITLHKIEK